jgi:hypothetical protein
MLQDILVEVRDYHKRSLLLFFILVLLSGVLVGFAVHAFSEIKLREHVDL